MFNKYSSTAVVKDLRIAIKDIINYTNRNKNNRPLLMFNKLDYCEVVVIGPNSQLGWSKKKEPYVNRSVALGEVSASSLRGRSGSMWG